MIDAISEEPFEFGHDDAFDVPSDLGERAECVPSLGRSLIAESYGRGDLEIHLLSGSLKT